MMKAEDRAEKVIEPLREARHRLGQIDWSGKWWSWNELGKLLIQVIRDEAADRLIWEETVRYTTAKLCSTIHDLLGPFDGRDPETDGPIDIETSGVAIRKAQAVLAEVE